MRSVEMVVPTSPLRTEKLQHQRDWQTMDLPPVWADIRTRLNVIRQEGDAGWDRHLWSRWAQPAVARVVSEQGPSVLLRKSAEEIRYRILENLKEAPRYPENSPRVCMPSGIRELSSLVERPLITTHIRWMIRRDMTEVVETEHESFTHPWTEEEVLRCLRQRNAIAMVAEEEHRVVAHMIYELQKTKLQILTFAVHPRFRRRGVGSQLLSKLTDKLSSDRRTRITMDVRETNLPGQLFLSEQGLEAKTVLRGFYDDTGEDAYVMQYRGFEPNEKELAEKCDQIL